MQYNSLFFVVISPVLMHFPGPGIGELAPANSPEYDAKNCFGGIFEVRFWRKANGRG
jgi:hypothetical protein